MPLSPSHAAETIESTRDQSAVTLPRRLPPFARFEPSRLIGVMSPDEYIARERRGEERLEYVEGVVVEVAGSSSEHSRISINTLRALGDALERVGADCDVHGSDLKIAISDRLYRYPDGTVVCGAEQIDPRDALQNPTLIVEVLSPSTEREDRTDKFREYQRIPSLRHYVLIDQQRPYVTHFEKLAQGMWAIAGEYTDFTESLKLTLDAHEISVPLTAIYRRISFAEVTNATESQQEAATPENEA